MPSIRLALLSGPVLLGLAGCTGPHLSEGFGRSYAAAFAAQSPPVTPVKKAATGLDSQEASIISGTYRRSLAPATAEPKDQPILLVAPGGAGGAPQALAPSVPSWK